VIRFAYLWAFLVAFVLTGPASATGGCGVGCHSCQKERASAMDGSKVCPFGTSARSHPGHLPLAAPTTDGVGNP
jgi:hypothetical protein